MLDALPDTRDFAAWTWDRLAPLYDELVAQQVTQDNVDTWLVDWTAVSAALDCALDPRSAAAILSDGPEGFRTLGGVRIVVIHRAARLDTAIEAVERGAAIGALIAIPLSLLAMAGRLRVRLGGDR